MKQGGGDASGCHLAAIADTIGRKLELTYDAYFGIVPFPITKTSPGMVFCVAMRQPGWKRSGKVQQRQTKAAGPIDPARTSLASTAKLT